MPKPLWEFIAKKFFCFYLFFLPDHRASTDQSCILQTAGVYEKILAYLPEQLFSLKVASDGGFIYFVTPKLYLF